MYCKNCGTENSDGDRFCKSCGQPLIGAILGGLYLIVYLVALIIYGSASLVLIGNEFV